MRVSCNHIYSLLPLSPLRPDRYFTEVSTDKNLKTTHPFLHSFVPSFLISPPDVTSPRGGSYGEGLGRGYFTRAARRILKQSDSNQLLFYKSFYVTDTHIES